MRASCFGDAVCGFVCNCVRPPAAAVCMTACLRDRLFIYLPRFTYIFMIACMHAVFYVCCCLRPSLTRSGPPLLRKRPRCGAYVHYVFFCRYFLKNT